MVLVPTTALVLDNSMRSGLPSGIPIVPMGPKTLSEYRLHRYAFSELPLPWIGTPVPLPMIQFATMEGSRHPKMYPASPSASCRSDRSPHPIFKKFRNIIGIILQITIHADDPVSSCKFKFRCHRGGLSSILFKSDNF